MGIGIRKLLVANRGEIARRVFAACRRLGIETVAVYSDGDASAPFVGEADEAVALGGVTAAESYLRVEALIEAARGSGADAVHPGYGFLAESAELARAVEEAGLLWIGPPPEAIEAMGSKVRARELMERAGVPVVPGAELGDGAVAAEVAERIGFPLLVKASAGGGGKGMRAVAAAAELEAAVEGARREAEAAFGDDTVFLERLLERPRHVEIQILADSRGETLSLGERECSIQRRHQKVIEEAPSPAVDAELRERMGEAAVAAAAAVGYVGAGTVEFLLGEEDRFFFLEMNTRLQVEHPVTEMVTGLDLVRLQLLIAAGEPLPAGAREAGIAGHAVEARLYAEDPAADFLPQTGSLATFEIPAAEPFGAPAGRLPDHGLRLDSSVETGTAVTPYFDPMLAKLIAWAPTRAEAVSALAGALARARLHGLITNRDFLVRVLRHPAFGAGETDTGFIERHEGLFDPLLDATGERAHAAAAAIAGVREPGTGPLGFAPPGWRNNPGAPTTVAFEGRGVEVGVAYRFGRESLEIELDGERVPARLHGRRRSEPAAGDTVEVDLELDGVRRRYRVSTGRSGEVHVDSALGYSRLREIARFAAAEGAAAEGALVAPMPGRVLSLPVEEGTEVEAGDVIAVLEAMKMEHELIASAAGTVERLLVGEGEQVEAGAVVAVIGGGAD